MVEGVLSLMTGVNNAFSVSYGRQIRSPLYSFVFISFILIYIHLYSLKLCSFIFHSHICQCNKDFIRLFICTFNLFLMHKRTSSNEQNSDRLTKTHRPTWGLHKSIKINLNWPFASTTTQVYINTFPRYGTRL